MSASSRRSARRHAIAIISSLRYSKVQHAPLHALCVHTLSIAYTCLLPSVVQIFVCQVILSVRTFAISKRSRTTAFVLAFLFLVCTVGEGVSSIYGRVPNNKTGHCTSGNLPELTGTLAYRPWSIKPLIPCLLQWRGYTTFSACRSTSSPCSYPPGTSSAASPASTSRSAASAAS